MKDREYSLMVDIDGTLAHHPKQKFEEWKPTPIGEPLPYAKEGMTRLIRHFKIIIFSTRKQAEGEAWLKEHGIPYDSYLEKPLNFLIIDDRAMQFMGDWKQTVKDIGPFQPWHKEPRKRVTRGLVLDFIDETIKRMPECTAALRMVRSRVELIDNLGR